MQHLFFHDMQTTNWAMASNIVPVKPKERDRTKRCPFSFLYQEKYLK